LFQFLRLRGALYGSAAGKFQLLLLVEIGHIGIERGKGPRGGKGPKGVKKRELKSFNYLRPLFSLFWTPFLRFLLFDMKLELRY
jgi:hypothetical protein